jgi:hypothetical protein
MKKIILALVLVLGFSNISIAKDGPFPGRAMAGIWNDTRDQRLVQVIVGAFDSSNKTYEVTVKIFDYAQNLLMSATTMQSATREDLAVNTSYKGKAVDLILRLTAGHRDSNEYRLVMEVHSVYENGATRTHVLERQ